MHTSVKSLNLDDLQSTKEIMWDAACNRAKLAGIPFSNELARRIERTGVTPNSLHPGVIATEFGGDGDLKGFNALMFRIMKWFLPGPETGARTSIYAARARELESVSGGYFEKCREKATSEPAQNEALAKTLRATTGAILAGSA